MVGTSPSRRRRCCRGSRWQRSGRSLPSCCTSGARSGAPSDAAGPLTWYAAGTAFLVASAALYFHFLTLGVADESLARRLIPTIGWLAIGLALLIAARSRTSAPGRVGIGFIAVAAIKALAYDSTHLQGPLRVTVFAAVGALLLVGARLINDRERA